MRIASSLLSRTKRLCSRFLRYPQRFKAYRSLMGSLNLRRISHRIATVEDAPGIRRLNAECYGREDDLDWVVNGIESLKGKGFYLVSALGKRIVGILVIRNYPENQELYPDWWIFGLMVNSRYRGRGIGEGLVRMALQEAAAQGAAKVYLWVFEHNKVAINLYRKLGFQRDSIPKLDAQLEEEAKKQGSRRIIMSKKLV